MSKIGILRIGRFVVLICLPLLFSLFSSSHTVRADPPGIYPLFLPIVTNTGKVSWIGPEGGHIVSIAVDPANSLKLYAGTWGSGMYRSDDGGITWNLINSGLGNRYINSLAINPVTSTTIYAGTYGDGVYKSVNSGETWVQTGPGLNQDAIVYTLAINPSVPDILYAGTRSPGSEPPWGGGVYRSSNGGVSWQDFNNGLGEDWVYDLVINPDLPTTLFAATHSVGVYKFTKAAGSWFPVNNGITDLSARNLGIVPLSPSTLYVGTWHGGGVFKTEDWGNTWSQVSTGLNGAKIYSLEIDPVNPQNVYVTTLYNGVYKTTNGGIQWTHAGLMGDFVYSIAVDWNNPSTLYAGTAGDGFFKSTDQSQTWVRRNIGLKATKITTLLSDPGSLGILYAGVYGGGVYKSMNLGQTWDMVNVGLLDKWIHVLTMSPDNPQVLYAGTDSSGIYKSTDGGMTWSDSNVGLPSTLLSAKSLASPYNHFPLEDNFEEGFWLDYQIDPYLAHSVSASTTNLSVRAIVFDPETPTTIYMGTYNGGVYKSDNGGATWSTSGLPGKSVYSLEIDPSNSSHVYAGVLGEDGNLLVSYDAGASWHFRNGGLGGRNVYSLLIDPILGNTIFAGTNDGLFSSSDGGIQWNSAGFSGLKVYELAMDASSSQAIFAGVSNGFYYSTDKGSTWQQDNTGLVNTVVQSLYLDPLSFRKYLGTDGSGGYRWNETLP